MTAPGSRSGSATTDEIIQCNVPQIYDTWICTTPSADVVESLVRKGSDEYTLRLCALQRSADHFHDKDHGRTLEWIRYEQALLHIRHEQWGQAMRILLPLWQNLSWRKSGWWSLLRAFDETFRQCAIMLSDQDSLLAVQWELKNSVLKPSRALIEDLDIALRNLPAPPSGSRQLLLTNNNVLSCLCPSFCFATSDAHVGLPLLFYVVIHSYAAGGTGTVRIDRVTLSFDQILPDVSIEHSARFEQESKTGILNHDDNIQNLFIKRISKPEKETKDEQIDRRRLEANLKLDPGANVVLGIHDIPREVGNIRISKIEYEFSLLGRSVRFVDTNVIDIQQHQWFHSLRCQENPPTYTTCPPARSLHVLPKPPKVRVSVLDSGKVSYVGENIFYDVLILNEEDEEANIALTAHIPVPIAGAQITGLYHSGSQEAKDTRNAGEDESNHETKVDHTDEADMSRPVEIGTTHLAAGETSNHRLSLRCSAEPAHLAIQLSARYNLASDVDVLVTSTETIEVTVKPPFELSVAYNPLFSSEPWPSYFEIDTNYVSEGIEPVGGISQRWILSASVTNLVHESIVLDSLEAIPLNPQESTTCRVMSLDKQNDHVQISEVPDGRSEIKLEKAEMTERNFEIVVQKTNLEDRRSCFFDFELRVAWHRSSPHAAEIQKRNEPKQAIEASSLTSSWSPTLTTLPLPELVVAFGEPRVLAAARPESSISNALLLEYVIENPSNYTLSFDVSLATSEEFAFSGVKHIGLQLLPLTRHELHYRVLPLMRGLWISPQLRVYDTQFHKTLKVWGTQGLRVDQQGISIWIDAEG